MSVRIMSSDGNAYSYPLLIKHLLHTPLATAPDHEIVYRDCMRYTYQDFAQRVGKLANVLTRLGAGQGSTVAMLDWDSHRYLESYFAVPMMGAILQTVNIRLSPDQIQYTLEHAGAEVLLVNREFLPMLEPLLPALKAVRAVVTIEDAPAPDGAPGFNGEYEALMAEASAEFDFEDFDENAVATTFYTTGTTGLPKGVCFTHRQLVLHTLASAAAFASAPLGQSFRQNDVYMPITPMFHVHAWGIPYVATMMGVKQVYPGRYEPKFLLELKAREGVTFSHCVPTILQMLLTAAAETEADLRGWTMTIGGSALSTGLLKQALDQGMDVHAGYGMSETGPILTLTRVRSLDLTTDEELAIRCRTGLPIPLVDLRVVDENMRDLPHDGKTPGELVVRAPWLTQLYVGNVDASQELWRGGYLHTQDIAVIDPQGYAQITDRLKDVIKTGGEWVSSLAIEDIISKHSGVAEVAVIGVANERWGERPVAFIVARSGVDAQQLPESVRQHVVSYVERGAISKFAVPEQVLVVTALEKTSVGKLNKKAMREGLVGRK